jgi:HAD superfamily hydrolase (TIGR01490 family)
MGFYPSVPLFKYLHEFQKRRVKYVLRPSIYDGKCMDRRKNIRMSLAIFDLDYTLVEGDCDALWCQFLLEHGMVDMAFINRIAEYYRDYDNGQLDFLAYETYLMQALAALDASQLSHLHNIFEQHLRFRLRPYVVRWLDWHRAQGHQVLMITATSGYLARPLADILGIQHMICSEVELQNEHPTGNVLGTIPYREGKVALLEAWLSHWDQTLQHSWGYSDSYNDLPLLQRVRHPVAVTPDPNLYCHALENGWDILT